MSYFDLVLIGALLLVGVYSVAWLAARAFFDNKAEYNRRLLRQLEEKRDAEKEGKGR